MMVENYVDVRHIQKHETEANWLTLAPNFIPKRGEIIVYDVDENYNYERMKIGDGLTLVNDLPFLAPQPDWAQTDENAPDYIKNKPEFSSSNQTQADWSQIDETQTDYIKNKPFGDNADGTVTTLDEKYIPSTIARSTDVTAIDEAYKAADNAVKAELIGSSGDSGTAVPDISMDGVYIDTVYFNTNKSVEETVTILKKLSYTDHVVEGQPGYLVAVQNNSPPYCLLIVDVSQITGTEAFYIVASNDTGDHPIFASTNMGSGTGWFIDSITFDATLTAPDEILLAVGGQNTILKDIISSTPFGIGDDASANTISGAKAYADNVITTAIEAAKTDATNKDAAILAEAQAYADGKVAGIVDSSPEALNTLNELAAALGDDPNFATTIATQIGGKADAEHIHTKSEITDFPTSMPASDVSAWAKASTKPSYTASEVGALPDTTVIPDALSDLSDDAIHRVVTDEEKATWNAKSDFSGSFNDLTDKPFSENEDGTINHLDEKFIPDTIARVADIPEVQGQVQADWNQTDDTQIDFIKNKPTIPEEQVNADWSVNKPSDKAYVKNRPFYAKDDYVDKNTIEFTKSEYGDMYVGQRNILEDAEEGKEYIVIFDDEEYRCVCTRVQFLITDESLNFGTAINFPVLGNPYLFTDQLTVEASGHFSEDTLRTNEPFVLICHTLDVAMFEAYLRLDLDKIVTNSTSNNHTIRIYGSDKYVKISNDYLPDNLATHEYVQEQISSIDIPEANASLPEVTSDDNGKVLSVVDGAWAAAKHETSVGVASWNDLTDKPFDTIVDTVFEGTFQYTYDETASSWDNFASLEDTSDVNLIVGETYTYTWGGQEYTSVCGIAEGCPAIGNAVAFGGVQDDQPVLIVRDADGTSGMKCWVAIMVNTPTDPNISGAYPVKITGVTVKHLDNKYLSILNEIPAEETDLLPEIAYTGFTYDDQYGAYRYDVDEAAYTLTIGETYFIEWDGNSYECIAQDGSALGNGAIILGNASSVGLQGNDEPFLFGWTRYGISYLALSDAVSHTVRIYTKGSAYYTIKEEYLPMDALKTYIDNYIGTALGGEY